MSAKTEVSQSSSTVDLVADLPIVKESTTSRAVVDNPLMRVVVFSFAAGQQLTEHATPRAVVAQVTTGTLDWTMRGETVSMQPGDVVYLAPREPHALVATTDCRLTLTMVNAGYKE